MHRSTIARHIIGFLTRSGADDRRTAAGERVPDAMCESLEPRMLLSSVAAFSPMNLGPAPAHPQPPSVIVQPVNPGRVPVSSIGQPGATQRAVWMWGAEMLDAVNNPVYRDGAIDFLEDKAITTVYLYAAEVFESGASQGNPLADQPAAYAALVSSLHDNGLEVYALLDSVDVGTTVKLVSDFQAVLDYNSQATVSGRFDGFNFDIEPWKDNQGWDANRAALSQDYLDMAAVMMQMKQAYEPSLVAGPAIAFWFDDYSITWNGSTRPMNEHVQSLFDYATIMDYRDTVLGDDGILFHAQNEIGFASQIGKPLVIGVETKADELDKLTFFEEGEAYMDQQLQTVAMGLQNNTAFAGFAIHDFAGYTELAGVTIPHTNTVVVLPDLKVKYPFDVDPDPPKPWWEAVLLRNQKVLITK